MTTRTWRFGPARVSVDIPEPLVRFVRRARGRDRMPQQGCLVLEESVPELHVQQRDADESMRFFRARQDDPTQVGHGLSGDGRPSRAAQPKSELAQRVAEFAWYHTIELPGGIVTPGIFDHRSLVPHYGIPERLDGNRVLDVATFDGFWAFEF